MFSIRKLSMSYAVVAIILGLFLILMPRTSSLIVCYIIGFVVLINGIGRCIRYMNDDYFHRFSFDLFLGVIFICLGLALIFVSDFFIMLFPTILGLFLLIDAMMQGIQIFKLKSYMIDSWKNDMLFVGILAMLGIVLLLNPFGAAMVSVVFIGCTLVYEGIVQLILLNKWKKIIKMIE